MPTFFNAPNIPWISKLCKLLSLETTCTMGDFRKQTTVDNTLSNSTTFAPFIKMTHVYTSYHIVLTNMLVAFRITTTTRWSMPLPELYLHIPTHDTWLSIMWTSTNNKHPWHTLMFCLFFFCFGTNWNIHFRLGYPHVHAFSQIADASLEYASIFYAFIGMEDPWIRHISP